MEIKQLIERFSELKVMIVGDVMIDRYMHGSVTRISPEAPVPVVHLGSEINKLGGAANVALNIHALNAQPIICTVVGNDTNGQQLITLLSEHGFDTSGIHLSNERQTTVKTRVMSGSQHLLRVDREDVNDLSSEDANQLITKIQHHVLEKNVDLIIFQDYDKGVLTKKVIKKTIEIAQKNSIPTTVDPKFKHFFDYKGVILFKPNLKEIRDAVPFVIDPSEQSLQAAATYVRQKLHNSINLITLSEHGLYIDSVEESPQLHPTLPRKIVDVCGAGDAVISIASMALAAGCTNKQIAYLSNLAGGQVCEKVGVAPIDLESLILEYTEKKKFAKSL